MYQLKRGKRPELLKRGFVINQWNECEKTLNNKMLSVRKRNIEVWYVCEDELLGQHFKECNLTKNDLSEFEILDLIEEI